MISMKKLVSSYGLPYELTALEMMNRTEISTVGLEITPKFVGYFDLGKRRQQEA